MANLNTARRYTAKVRQNGRIFYMPVIAKTSINALVAALRDIDISAPFSICIRSAQ